MASMMLASGSFNAELVAYQELHYGNHPVVMGPLGKPLGGLRRATSKATQAAREERMRRNLQAASQAEEVRSPVAPVMGPANLRPADHPSRVGYRADHPPHSRSVRDAALPPSPQCAVSLSWLLGVFVTKLHPEIIREHLSTSQVCSL